MCGQHKDDVRTKTPDVRGGGGRDRRYEDDEILEARRVETRQVRAGR